MVKTELTVAELEILRTAMATPGPDGQNLDRLCFALLIVAAAFLDKLIEQEKAKQP